MPALMLAAGVAVLCAALMVLIRALLGPTVFDRVLAVNAMGTKTVILVALIGFISRRADFLDVALLYALMNFIATIAILKFIEHKRLS